MTVWWHDARNLRGFRRSAKTWYARNQRNLPWRAARDPYRIWISEVMLQQTQVETVKGYYARFLDRFPTVQSLAAADETEVLRYWEGLGYYRRARQLHAAAQQIVVQHNGQFPTTLDEVRRLKGIGRYTAGAILSIAFDQRQPIVEANTVRLYARLTAMEIDPRSSAGQTQLWDFAERILPRRDVGLFNQAMMEIGSLVCVPKKPDCDACPLRRFCPTAAHGWQQRIPMGTKKTKYEAVEETAVAVIHNQSVLVRACGDDERWAGLWDFPRCALQSAPSDVVAEVRRQTGITADIGPPALVIKHAVTRFRITLTCHHATYVRGRLRPADTCRWASRSMLDELPLSVTGRKIAASIRSLLAVTTPSNQTS